jgi:hypothetical protein
MQYDRVILHVGTGKTGTTTIQAFHEQNRERLLESGFLYIGPHGLPSYPQTNEATAQSLPLAAGLSEIHQFAKKHKANNLVWSRESLTSNAFLNDPERIRLIKKELPANQYQVIIYLRRQDSYLPSAYLQWGVKEKPYKGPTLDLEDWIQWRGGLQLKNFLDLDYYQITTRWSDVFGAENVTVRPFEKQQLFNGDLLSDYFHVANFPKADYCFDIPNQNVTFNTEFHQMLGLYNSVFEEASHPLPLIRFLEAQANDPFFSRKFFSRFTMSPKIRREVLELCEETNRNVAKTFLNREDGVLFRDPWPLADAPYEPCPDLTLERLTPILLHIMQKQSAHVRQMENRLKQLENRHARSFLSRVANFLRELFIGPR